MSTIKPIVSASLSDEAFDKVVEAITSGEFAPGQRLSEAELARNLGISRGPLREALGRLEGRLVMRTPRIGVHVISLDRDMVDSMFRAREALEGMAARLACERMSDAEIAGLRDLLHAHANQPQISAGEAYIQRSLDEDFHLAILRGARSETIERLLMNEVYYQMRISRRKSSAQPGRALAALNEHRAILAGIESRDPDQAEQAIRTHLRNARFSALASLN